MNELRRLLLPVATQARQLWLAALLLLCTFAYFVPAPAWNQNSRLALTRALVEHGSVVIDPYHVTTGDKSYRDGHFYCDKAPGLSLLAAVPYAAFVGIRLALDQPLPDVRVQPLDPLDRLSGRVIAPEARQPGDLLVYNRAHRLALYLSSLLTVGLASVAAAFALYLLSRRRSGSHRRALLCALTYALGTPALTYGTTFYGHQLCASFAIVAYALVLSWPSDGRDWLGGVLSGAALGLATMTEYPAVLITVAVGLLAAYRRGWRFTAFLVLGGLPFAGIVAGYHVAAFGSPWKTGYDFVYLPEFAEGMAVAYGFARPDPAALFEITFGAYRGLFAISPVLLLAAWGLVQSLRERGEWPRTASLTALAVVVAFLLLNAGYYMWDGGASSGPRHLVPMLPFLAVGLDPALRHAPRAFVILAGYSIAAAVVLAAAGAEAPQWGNLLWEFAVPELLGWSERGRTLNVGRLLGLPAAASLLPLLLVWLLSWPRLWSDQLRASKPAANGQAREAEANRRRDGHLLASTHAEDRPTDRPPEQ